MRTGLKLYDAVVSLNLQPVVSSSEPQAQALESALVSTPAWSTQTAAEALQSWLTHSSTSFLTSGYTAGADATFLKQGERITLSTQPWPAVGALLS